MTFQRTPQGLYAYYRVTFYSWPSGSQAEQYFTYTICTGMGEHKAVAWAALVHSEKHPDRSITDVNIESVGKPTTEGDYFMDRWEG